MDSVPVLSGGADGSSAFLLVSRARDAYQEQAAVVARAAVEDGPGDPVTRARRVRVQVQVLVLRGVLLGLAEGMSWEHLGRVTGLGEQAARHRYEPQWHAWVAEVLEPLGV